jgi:hypothetical protein
VPASVSQTPAPRPRLRLGESRPDRVFTGKDLVGGGGLRNCGTTLTLPPSFNATVRDFLLQPIAQISGRRLQFSREMPVFVIGFRASTP